MATYKSWDALKKAIQKEMKEAMEEAVDATYQDTKENVDYFYSAPEGRYKRTGQLSESVESEISGSGNHLKGSIRLDTTYNYNPAGRDTQTIYGYAEDGGLLGYGGFWAKTKEDCERNIKEAFGKSFHKK